MNLKIYRDYKNTVDTAYDEGKIEGKLEGKIEVAKALKLKGVSTEIIIQATGLSESEIDKL